MASWKTVLIVDDDRDTRYVLGAILNYDGYHVIEAASGTEGVQAAQDGAPDVILMDIHLGGMSGIEAAKLLRAGARTRSIPVVAFTGDPDVAYGEPKAGVLFHSVLTKPAAPMKVLRHIRAIIGDP